MSELKQMGETLTELALSFTHPQFSDSYPEWSTVFNIGEELIAMSEPKLNENQESVLKWLKERYKKYNERPSTVIYFLTNHYSFAFEGHGKAKRAFRDLDIAQELQVLQLFNEWALDQC